MLDRHSAIGFLGAISSAFMAEALDIYTKLAGAGVATLSFMYMLHKYRQANKHPKHHEKRK